jgi:L-asparagine oxygenase
VTPSFPVEVAAYDLRPAELNVVEGTLGRLQELYPSAQDPGFLADARRLALCHLPVELVRFLGRFARTEFAPAVAVTGLPVDDARIGPTPPHWDAQPDPCSTLREELYLVLLGSMLGEPFGWATLQRGRLIHNVLPIRNQEHEQSGHGSLASLAWHTEDGFHPYRCDYLSLLGLRNHTRVPTTVAAVEAVHLTPGQRRVLAEPRFVIRPDNEHLRQRRRRYGGPVEDEPLPPDWTNPRPTAVLFGDPEGPYLRIDPYFMSALPGDTEAEAALAAIVAQLDAAIREVVVEPGTVLFVDNYHAVHGRQAFTCRYDGTDRWLKKLLLTRDLRKSRAARAGPEARVLRAAVLSDDAAPVPVTAGAGGSG